MSSFLTQYQSANLSDDQIIDNFVVRTKEFQRVMADIRSTPIGTSPQHYVFVGRRGSGKSTLLRRIQAEVHKDEDLNTRFRVANLSEEQAGIYKLYDLWDYVLRDLKEQGLDVPSVDWQDYQDDLKEYTKTLYSIIQELLEKEAKQLIILIDNIDRLFRSIGPDANLLREQLMNHNHVRIIGGSTIMAEDFWRYDMPFYQFFSIKRLEPLTMKEIGELLEHWATAKNNPEIADFVKRYPGKIQVIRMLTDGTPRTMQLFVDMLIDRQNEQGYEYLRRIIDHATPIYQERLLQLSPQQQKIITELSFFWEATPIEQLVPVCKMKGKDISAQMSQLVKMRIVEKVKGETKNNYYRLEERFFNLWLLMTQGGPKQKREAKYLTVFLEAWYEPEELQQVFEEICSTLKNGQVKPDYAFSMAKALSHSKHIDWAQRDWLLDLITERFPQSNGNQHLPEKTLLITKQSIKLAIEKGLEAGIKMMNTIEQLDTLLTSMFFLEIAKENNVPDSTSLANELSRPGPNRLSWRSGLIFTCLVLSPDHLDWFEGLEPEADAILNNIHLRFDERVLPPLMTTALWAGKMDQFERDWSKYKFNLSQEKESKTRKIFQYLLIQKQYNKLLEAFNSEEHGPHLKEVLKPHYYALLHLVGGHEVELRRMPPELTQAVQDLVAYIRERQAFFFG